MISLYFQKVAEAVNGKQCSWILGWFKPAQDEDGAAVENKQFHKCFLLPATELETEQSAPTESTPATAPSLTATAAVQQAEGSGQK